MNHSAIILILFALHFKSICQSSRPAATLGPAVFTPAGATTNDLIVDPGWRVTTLQAGAVWGLYDNIKGSAFYSDGWHKGYILLQDKRIAKNISLSFNIYANQLFYLQDSQALILDASVPVEEFGINDQIEDSNKMTMFRCGYPSTGRNNEKTFYQVLSGSRIALLKHYNKSIVEINNSIGIRDKTFIDSETWYVYDPDKNKMFAIKRNKNSLIDALPQYAGIIQSIIQLKNLKLKNESDWAILFDELNNQTK
jgi:hypothetical protein